MKPKSKKFKN